MAASQLLFLAVAMAAAATVAGDAEVVVDFCVKDFAPINSIRPTGGACKDLANVTSADFKHTLTPTAPGGRSNVGVAVGFADQWPGINGLQIGIARLNFGVNGQVGFHHHPRATEIFYVVEGKVLCGFIDSAGSLYEEAVSAGQAFVFPRGLIHYQQNVGKGPASGIASFNSQDPGLQPTFSAVLGSKPLISSKLLAQALNVKTSVVDSLRKALGA